MSTVKQIFLNLPVKDLQRSVAFFTKMGFIFDPKFTDENATSMQIGENIYVMLLTEKFFSTFIAKPLADTQATAAAIVALSVGSREEADEMADKGIAAGGKQYKEAEDHGWMYGRNFQDLDGHLWEFFYMDMSALPQG